MIAEVDRVDSSIICSLRVLDSLNPLQPDRQCRSRTKPSKVLPVQRGVDEAVGWEKKKKRSDQI